MVEMAAAFDGLKAQIASLEGRLAELTSNANAITPNNAFSNWPNGFVETELQARPPYLHYPQYCQSFADCGHSSYLPAA